MSAKQYEQHPYGQLIPKMKAKQFADLQDSIEANDLQQPIKLYQGMILDGWNRYTACNNINTNSPEKSVSIRFETFEGNDQQALAFVLDVNLARRHLTEQDRIKVALKVRKELQKLADDEKPEGKIDAAAARAAGVSERTVSRAAKVEKHGDKDITEAMESGDITPAAAEKLLKADKKAVKKAISEVRKAGGKARREVLKEAVSSSVKDLAKRTVPKSLVKFFTAGDDLDVICQEMKRIMKLLKEAGKVLPSVYTQTIISNMTSVEAVLMAESPAWVCQKCQGDGESGGKKCNICKGNGYIKRGNGREPKWD